METPGAQCPGWLEIDTGRAQFDHRERRLIDGHEKVRATFRNLNEAKQTASASVFKSDRARIAVRIERTKRKCDARCASMQFLEQFDGGFGANTRQRQIGESG